MERSTIRILGADVDAACSGEAIARILGWARRRESRCVAICNVHVVVTAQSNHMFAAAVNQADLATPDGAPVAWMMRRLGVSRQRRVSGPDLMWGLCSACETLPVGVFFYGSTPATLGALESRLRLAFPTLSIVGSESPPFREATPDEDQATVERINRSGAGIVFVGLGCPKQELWMAAHRGRVDAVMIGVGAAFDFHAGIVRRAPRWMRDHGLEWLYRLLAEPRRLWRRYLVTNTLFVVAAVRQLLSRGHADRSR